VEPEHFLSDDIRTVIREYVQGSARFRRPGLPTDTSSLGTAQSLDSLALVELVTFLETRFGIEFSSRDLDRRKLETVEQIERLVMEKRSQLDGRARPPATDA
jgi:acyl carrier protein